MKSLGINVGSSSLKVVELDNAGITLKRVVPHEGDFAAAVRRIVGEERIPEGIPSLITGTEGRFLFTIDNVIEPLCIEAALDYLSMDVDAVVTMGGEDLVEHQPADKRAGHQRGEVDQASSLAEDFPDRRQGRGVGGGTCHQQGERRPRRDVGAGSSW